MRGAALALAVLATLRFREAQAQIVAVALVDTTQRRCIDDKIRVQYTTGLVRVAGAQPDGSVHTDRTDCRGAPQGWWDFPVDAQLYSSFSVTVTGSSGCSNGVRFAVASTGTRDVLSACTYATSGAQRPYVTVVITAVPATNSPSGVPTTQSPTATPTRLPTTPPTAPPTHPPTGLPTTDAPTEPPTTPSSSNARTPDPTAAPTAAPSGTPTFNPTAAPSVSPTSNPTAAPSAVPTAYPTTAAPSGTPTLNPTAAPSAAPTSDPTAGPTTPPTGATAVPATVDAKTGSGEDDGFTIIIIIVCVVIVIVLCCCLIFFGVGHRQSAVHQSETVTPEFVVNPVFGTSTLNAHGYGQPSRNGSPYTYVAASAGKLYAVPYAQINPPEYSMAAPNPARGVRTNAVYCSTGQAGNMYLNPAQVGNEYVAPTQVGGTYLTPAELGGAFGSGSSAQYDMPLSGDDRGAAGGNVYDMPMGGPADVVYDIGAPPSEAMASSVYDMPMGAPATVAYDIGASSSTDGGVYDMPLSASADGIYDIGASSPSTDVVYNIAGFDQ
eukprot:m.304709 g.304709  ORF g.304709 m.304709 type:complete len:550 (-) comp27328_c0_seq3:1568-3217(-)